MARADSDNDLLQQELHRVATGQPLKKVLDDHIVLRRIHAVDDSLWHLLVMTGYLKAQFAVLTPDERRAVYHLSIPNLMDVMERGAEVAPRCEFTKVLHQDPRSRT